MSIHCLSHVMKHSEAQLGARLVLFVLAEHAHDDGSNAYPTVATIVERTRMSRRAVQAALRRLEGDEMIARRGMGSAGQAKWQVIMGGEESAPLEAGGGEVDDTEGAKLTTRRGEAASPEPSVNPSEILNSASSSGWESLPTDVRADAKQLLKAKTKVGRRLVTEPEMLVAAVALTEFNRLTESDYGLGAHLTMLVMRIRERPSWDAAKHVRLVQSAARLRWWEQNGKKHRAGPQVIYGNSKVFENVAQDARNEAEARARFEADHRLATKFYDGRSWDELTPREQSHARQSVSMGIKPWERRADAVPLPGTGEMVTDLLAG